MRAEPTNSEAVWKFGAACFDLGEFATNDTQRATLAVEAINVMRGLVERQPRLAQGHYFLAMNMGQLARTKTLGALTIVSEMEKEFKVAHDLDENFDFAGADRNLGQLYFQAPGWPASIGSNSKARKHLERAVELAPSYPDNHLCLLEAYIYWNDKKGIGRELRAMEALWPKAKEKFSGDVWASAWADWDERRERFTSHANQFMKAK